MNLIYVLLFINFVITKVYSSSDNLLTTDLVIQILAAADESCIYKSYCKPKTNIYKDNNISEHEEFIKFDIINEETLKESENINIINKEVSLKDLISELRQRDEKNAIKFYTYVLFPAAKEAFNKYFGLKNYDDFDEKSTEDQEKIRNIIRNTIKRKLDDHDIIKELLNNDENPISLFSSNVLKNIHYIDKIDDKISNRKNYLNKRKEMIIEPIFNNKAPIKFKTVNEDTIPVNIVNKFIEICRDRITCNKYFKYKNPSSGNFEQVLTENINISILESEINGVKNYHFIINDLVNEKIVHPLTLKQDNDKIEINKNYMHKEVNFYNRFDFNGKIDEISEYLSDEFTKEFIKFKNENKYKSKKEFQNGLNKDGISSDIFDKLKDLFKNNGINIKNNNFLINDMLGSDRDEDIGRLLYKLIDNFTDICFKIKDLDEEEIKKNIKENVKNILNKEQNRYDTDNNIFDYNLISRALKEKSNLSDNEIDHLKNMLNKYTNLDKSEINRIDNSLKGKDPKISDENCKEKLNKILAGNKDMFNENFEKDLYSNKLTFSSYDINKRSISSIVNEHDRHRYKNFSSGNQGYVKNYENSLLGKYGFILVDSNTKLSIPQQNDININNKNIKYEINGYIFKEDSGIFDEYKLNMNGVGLKDQDNISGNNNLSNIIEILCDSEKNKNLDIHINTLLTAIDKYDYNSIINYIIGDVKEEKEDDTITNLNKKFKDPDHWVNNILLYRLKEILVRERDKIKDINGLDLDIFEKNINSIKKDEEYIKLCDELNKINNEIENRSLDKNAKKTKIKEKQKKIADIQKYLDNLDEYKNAINISKELTKFYALQSLVLPNDKNINEGKKADHTKCSNQLVNKIIKNELDISIIKTEISNINDKSNNIIENICNIIDKVDEIKEEKIKELRNSNSNNKIDLANSYITHLDTEKESKCEKLKKLMDDYNNQHYDKENNEKKKMKYDGINFNDNYISSDSKDGKVINTQNIIYKLVESEDKINKNKTDRDLVHNMLFGYSVKSLYQNVFPIGKSTNIVGMGFELSHLDRLEPNMKFIKDLISLNGELGTGTLNNKELCKYKRVRKRDNSNSLCLNMPGIKTSESIDDKAFKTLDVLKMFKEMNLNPNILPYTTNLNDINNEKLLIKDAKSVDEVWNTIVDTYQNYVDKFDNEQSEIFIKNFNSVINDYILEFIDSNYNDNSREVDENRINKLLLLRSKAIDIHKNKFKNIEDIELYSLDSNNSQSKCNKNKYRRIIEKLSKMVGINPNIVIDSEDPISAINNLCEQLNKLDDIEDIDSVYNDIQNLKSINDIELYNNDKTSLNSELIHILYNYISERNGIEIDDNIMYSENNLKVLNNNKINNLSKYEQLSDMIAFIILAAGNEDGSLAKELDENGKLVPIKIKVMINGEEKELSINKIIPNLKELKSEELEKEFNKLYEMASLHFLEHFDLQNDKETNELYYNELPEETIKKGNVISYIINPYNINENDEIEYFDLEPDNMNIQYSENDKLDNNFKEFVSSINEKDVENIDINNYDKISNYKTEEWESKLGSDYDEDTKYFYKVLAIQCAKSKKCKEQFKNTNKDKLAFNIINYNTEEKGNTINNYSLIIHNDETKQSMNAFTFKMDDTYEYKIDEININKEYSYNELSKVNNNKNAIKVTINNKEYAMRPGIGLIAECGFEFEDSNGNIVKPDQYAIKNSDEKIINDKIIEQKYGVENNGEYDMNLVRKEALDLDIDHLSNSDLDSSSFKEVGKLMINKRNNCNSNEHCELTDNEIDTFNDYSNLLLKNDLHDEKNGMVHYSNEKEFNSNYDDIKETVNIQNEIKTIKNHKSGCLSGANSLRKRNNNKCLKCIEMSRNYGVEDNLISLLNILKKYDSKNIKVKEDEKNISNPKELCKNAATLTEVINIFLDSYENIDNMNKEDSEKMIIKLQNFVKGLEFRYKNARYLTHESIRDINKYDINDMMGLCNDLLDIHESKFGKIIDNNGKKIGKISESTSEIESESKYMNDELHEVLNNVHDILNEYNQDITNVNLVDDMDINNKSDRDERTYEVSYLLDEIEKIAIGGSKESKEKIKSDLLKIFGRLIELGNIIDKANFNNDEFVNNSEVIYKLSDGIVNKLKNNFSEDKEVQEKLKIYKDNINGIRKTNVKSSNILNLDHIISQVDMEDYIFNDSRSKMYVKMFFDKLKNEFCEIDTDEGYETMNKKINEIKDKINEKIKRFNNYNKFEGNYQEAYHLVELINNYNELISTALNNDRDNTEINYIYISNDSELNSRLNYVRLSTKQKNENKILKSNPKQFNNENNKKIEEIIDKNVAKKYAFGTDVVSEATYSDYIKIMLDKSNIKSNIDVLKIFVDSSTNNNQLIGFKQSYNLGYKLMTNELSDYRDEDMVNSINHLESSKKTFNNIKNNNIRYFETSKQTETRYKNNILSVVELKNIKPEDVSVDNILYIVNDRDLIKNMDENKISAFENQIQNECMFEKNELIRYSGNTPGDSFEEINNGYDSFSSKIIILLKKLPNNNNKNDEHYKKLKTNKNLVNHNNAFIKNLSKSNPIIKRPPTNKHKLGNTFKRNMNNIKYYY